MIKAILFDLDDTLIDTSKLLIPIAHSPDFLKRLHQPLPLMPGVENNLLLLAKKYQLFLLTQGDFQVQSQKVKAANCAHFFKKVYICDPALGQNKAQFIQQVLKDQNLKAQELLSFGNRRSVEIREAKRLGCWTCLFLHGEHSHETIEQPEDNPDFEIHHHDEMIDTCHL